MVETHDTESFLKDRQNSAMVKNRLMFIMSFFCILFTIIAYRSTEITVLSAGPNVKKDGSYNSIIKTARSEIVDRNGYTIATNLKTASVYANPKEILDIEEAVNSLSTAVPDLDATGLLVDFDKDTKFVWVKRHISPKEQKAINDLGVPGIYFTEDIKRVYPHENLLSHVLGYVDIDNKGLAGVEREFDELLAWGSDDPLQLSIDLKIQHILRDELAKQMIGYDAIGAAGMVMDAKTGEVIAMVSLPDFNSNNPKIATSEQKFNRITQAAYEMGSTIKPITAAMALDYGVANLNSSYDASKPLKYAKHTIHDYHAKNRVLTLPEVIMYSSNIGSAKMAMKVGTKKQQEFLKKVGMFDKTEIELPEKSTPLKPKTWREINTMTISFGHGIAVSPAHIAKAFTSLVNGGNLHPMTLLKKKSGDIIKSKKVVSKETSDKIRGILRLVVEKGTSKGANASGYIVGGKTGTSEKLVNGKYSKTKLMSSFVGAFPMNNPQYVVVVAIDEPKQQKKWVRPTGGVVAAPIVGGIIERTGPILGIQPQYEEELPKDAITVRYQNKNVPTLVSVRN